MIWLNLTANLADALMSTYLLSGLAHQEAGDVLSSKELGLSAGEWSSSGAVGGLPHPKAAVRAPGSLGRQCVCQCRRRGCASLSVSLLSCSPRLLNCLCFCAPGSFVHSDYRVIRCHVVQTVQVAVSCAVIADTSADVSVTFSSVREFLRPTPPDSCQATERRDI